jgi:hypothetical protein
LEEEDGLLVGFLGGLGCAGGLDHGEGIEEGEIALFVEVEFENFVKVVGNIEGMFDFISDILCTVIINKSIRGVRDGAFDPTNSGDKFFR